MNVADLKLLPYCEMADMGMTLSPHFVKWLYERTEQDYPGVVFYDGKINNADEFFVHVSRKDVFLFVAVHKDTPIAYIYFNRCDQTHAHGHWCFFKGGLSGDEKVMVGRWIMKKVYSILPYSVLVGHIPVLNARAVEFAKQIGMTEVGVIPDLLYSKVMDAPIAGTVLYIQRKDVADESLHEDFARHRLLGS